VSSPARGRRRLFSAAVIAGYLLLGLIAFWPSLLHLRQRVFSGDGDFTLSTWMLGWVAHALVHGLNPFFSNGMFVPTGVNLAQNTQGPLLGLVAAPITLTYGPTVTANLLLVLAMPVSAAAAFIVLRKWQVWGPAAALGGLVYGFSPYMIGQAIGHPVLYFLALPPFIVSTLVSMLLRRGSDRRLGLQLGVLAAAQFLISPEIFASLALLVGLGLLFVVLRNPRRAFQTTHDVIRPIGIALAVSVVLLAYPVWMLLAGPQHVSGPTYPLGNEFHNDLLSFIIPGPLQRNSLGTQTTSAGSLAAYDPMEAGGYLGVPVLITAGLLAWRSRHRTRTQLSLALLASSALLSLGPFLSVHGHRTHLPLPFWIIGHLPLVDNLLPVRFSFETSACVAAIIAFGLDDLRQLPRAKIRFEYGGREKRRAVRAGIATCAVLAALVVTQVPRWPYVTVAGDNPLERLTLSSYAPVPAARLPSSLSQMIPAGDPVALTYPYAYGHLFTRPLLWQAEAGYRYRLLGGYAFHPNQRGNGTVYPNPLEPNALQRYLAILGIFNVRVPVPPELVAATQSTISRYHVRLIIVDRSQPGATSVMFLFRRAVSAPTLSAGHFSMWIVPERQ
jgi:hypothetical protein